jgi:2-keto-3-deoxy-L-rhamnonate aldolase RhmA
MIPYHVAMKEKKLSLGMYYSGKELLPTLAQTGFNHIIIDHMFSGVDWGTTADLCTHARLCGIAPFVRVQTYPWSGEPNGDMRAISHVARARTVGAAGALVSFGSVSQLTGCMRVATDPEHMAGIGNGTRAFQRYQHGGWAEYAAPVPADLREFPIVAYIEVAQLLDEPEEIVSVPGLKAIGFGIHDVSLGLGHPFDVEHPDVWEVIDRFVDVAKPRGISVWTNTGVRFSKVGETIDRISRLFSHGIDTIQVQTPSHYLFSILDEITTTALSGEVGT